MKTLRLAFALMLMGAAACSSPTEPRLPQPQPDDDEEPNQPGMTAFQSELPEGVSFG